ncbi:hypothetical protein MBAV_004797 [Candidatus Magnetobacterium bavaricum]|uniref:Uncharacterized protein n=1 Tax=Candidatus Magnetobacterium bavaricum TaxID=29290 RepID=A0A0F3GM64_9BACT|nr:hypothetical protein MBAV_004797 [Candidatus Magnetobacterium bavaricum]
MLQEDIQDKMKNPEFKMAWHGLDAEFQIVEDLLREREGTEGKQSKFTDKDGKPMKNVSGDSECRV